MESAIANQLRAGEREIAIFSANGRDHKHVEDLTDSVIPCADAQVVGLYLRSKPVDLTVLAAKPEAYTAVTTSSPQPGTTTHYITVPQQIEHKERQKDESTININESDAGVLTPMFWVLYEHADAQIILNLFIYNAKVLDFLPASYSIELATVLKCCNSYCAISESRILRPGVPFHL